MTNEKPIKFKAFDAARKMALRNNGYSKEFIKKFGLDEERIGDEKMRKLNFIEAVEEMKKGKKVRRECFADRNQYLYLEEGVIKDSKYDEPTLRIDEIEATDWQVVEDDWNLANCESAFEIKCNNVNIAPKSYKKEDVEKCRYKILEDMQDEIELFNCRKIDIERIQDIINNRFGDL